MLRAGGLPLIALIGHLLLLALLGLGQALFGGLLALLTLLLTTLLRLALLTALLWVQRGIQLIKRLGEKG